jgi:hypothetical protein
MMKLALSALLAVVIVGYVVLAYGQVGPCEIVTIVKDGKITNCTICGTIVNCM